MQLGLDLQQHTLRQSSQDRQKHEQKPGSLEEDEAKALTTVRKSSCDYCTRIKVKCSGNQPCLKCVEKSLVCKYSLCKKRGPPKGYRKSPAKVARSRKAAAKFVATPFSESVTLEEIRRRLDIFAQERNWERFHSPRNLLMAMVGEVGELSELFQWKGDKESPTGLANWSAKERVDLRDELADVFIYLIRLSDRCNVDLMQAAIDKIAKNGIKYPPLAKHGEGEGARKMDDLESSQEPQLINETHSQQQSVSRPQVASLEQHLASSSSSIQQSRHATLLQQSSYAYNDQSLDASRSLSS